MKKNSLVKELVMLFLSLISIGILWIKIFIFDKPKGIFFVAFIIMSFLYMFIFVKRIIKICKKYRSV